MAKNKWTFENIPDLTGKVIIITGANAGLGFEASKQLARKGATVIMACRNIKKATAAVNQLKKEIPTAAVEFIQLDLASLRSVRSFAETFKAKYDRLDVLLNNAGIMFGPYIKTEDGFESTFGIDHLGHFALTGLLIDLIKNTSGSRVVNVSSFAHNSGKINFDDLMFEKGYDPGKAYPQAKLANVLFTNELQRRFEKAGIDSKATSVNPGFVKTGWIRHMRERNRIQAFLTGMGLQVLGQSVEMGGLSLLRAAIDPEVKGGEYISTSGRFGGHPIISQSSETSLNKDIAFRLWEVSEKLTGITFLFEKDEDTKMDNLQYS